MQKVKAFFENFLRSCIPQKPYYHSLTRSHPKINFRFFLKVMLLANFIGIIHFIIIVNPVSITTSLGALKNSLAKFPFSSRIEKQNNRLSTTLTSPYFLWISPKDKMYLLAVVDENANNYKIREYQSLSLLTKKNLLLRTSIRNRPLIIDVNRLPNFIINKESVFRVQKDVDSLISLVPFIYIPCLIVLAFLFFIASLITTLVYIIVASVVVYLLFVFILRGKFDHYLANVSLKSILKISLHAAALPIILDYLFTLTPPIFLLILILFVSVGVYEAYLDVKSTS